ncbi:MAG TPA: SAM-dependent chlorinase/fluorinase [Gemmatales bacterium]|nr:SAM-dependent chlorinase/fluorinase [Gemmatales bacterium]
MTTDFGNGSPYVAVMKGVVLSGCPHANLIDLSHEIPPQDVLHAAYFLREMVPWYPGRTIHIVVVDPGVGTERLAICVQINGQFILCPDNGVWTLIEGKTEPVVHELSNRTHQLEAVSHTFHGRDVFAPGAAALANGFAPEELGRRCDSWQRLSLPMVRQEQGVLYGEVVFVDHFGNLITNIPAEVVPKEIEVIRIRGELIQRMVKTYGMAVPGELIALISSSGYLEIAEVNGNAARRLNVGRGERVECIPRCAQAP